MPETPSQEPPRSRPLSVWLVSGWYFMSGFFSISILAAVRSRVAELPVPIEGAVAPAQLETGDLILAALLIAINLTGAGFLFLLKKTAVPFFKLALALNVGTNVWYLISRGTGDQPALILLGVVLGWLVAACVCRYADGLVRKGILR